MSTLHELEADAGHDIATDDYWAQARASVILDWIDDINPDRIADIGCGSGYLTAAIADRGHDAIGLDIDPELIDVARNRETEATFEVGDALDLPWPEGHVDACLFADVIEHFEDPAPLLDEAHRVLRPDGEVILSVPALRTLHGPHDTNQDHYDRYNRKRLRWLAERNGFEVVETAYTNAIPLLPYFVTQRILRTDVPAGARGRANGYFEPIKNRLLDAEQLINPPVGVTLLARLSPRPTSSKTTTNILLMNYEYPPECGGGGVFTKKLNDHLSADGIDVDLVIGDAASARQSNAVSDLVQFPFRSFPELVREIREQQPDVINAHFSLPTAAALPIVKWLTGIPYVVSIMGADVHDPTRYHRFRPIMSALNRWGVFRHADRVIAPSADMRSRLPKGIRLKTDVIPFFIDAERFPETEHPEPHDPLRLLTVARLVPRKNLDTVAEAVAECDIPVEWSVVGSGSVRPELEAQCDELGINDRVTFHGHVPNRDVPPVYRDHDVFILPSKHEGFGIVYLEALASGLPVIGATVGGQTDIITDDVGATVPPDSSAAIRGAIESIADDYRRYQSNARDRVVDNFTHEQVVPAYRRVFDEVAQ